MQVKIGDKPMPCVVMTDGELNAFGMENCGWSKERILRTLQNEKIAPSSVMLMTADSNGDYRVIRKEE